MGFGSSGTLAAPQAGSDSGAAAGDTPPPVPQESFFSSLKQAFKQDFDHEVVRGHFDVGSAPDLHRYYCLVDPKTAKKEPNGVPGKPVLRPDGMTGIKATAVSTYSCASAEQQGILVTAGYVLTGAVSGVNSPAPRGRGEAPAPASPAGSTSPAAVASPAAAAEPALSPNASPGRDVSPSRDTAPSRVDAASRVDVAGLKLGMSPDEVRALLKSKKLGDYYESTDTLGYSGSTGGASRSTSAGRFVNVIAAWTSPRSSADGGPSGEDGESFDIMFTPVPGRERAMAIIHSAAYSPANAVRELDLRSALVAKYGGFAGAGDLPASPTWRIQSAGSAQVGDSCGRRGIVGGLGGLNPGTADRKNLALKTTLDEFRFQIDRCGVAIVTEDHSTNGDGAQPERTIARFTVTAYSPSIGFEGAAAAAQLIGAGGIADASANSPRKNRAVPNL